MPPLSLKETTSLGICQVTIPVKQRRKKRRDRALEKYQAGYARYQENTQSFLILSLMMTGLKSQCHPKCFARLCFCFETAFCVWLVRLPEVRKLYRANWPFSELICTIVTSENRNIFIARCYWRKQLKI